MTERTYLTHYDRPVTLSHSTLRNLAIVQVNYAYTGVMELATGIIDLCAAAGNNPHYNTIDPLHTMRFPQYVGNVNVAPIVHGGRGSGNTSHQTLARCVINDKCRLATSEEGFCGFTIRFNAKPGAEFSGTSRSLNMGSGFGNGELEVCLRELIMKRLKVTLSIYGWSKLVWVRPRADPDATQRQRGRGVAAPGLFASIQGHKRI